MKDTAVASIDLEPRTTGISMAFGQTRQVSTPSAKTCKGDSASVTGFTYGTTNSQLVDISPSGELCAGTWNRNSGGGIANYTICNKPNPLPSTGSLPYATAYISASANSVTSNPVEVYVHAQVTSLTLVGPQSCLSQGTLWQAPLDVQGCYSSNGQQFLMCAPASVTSGYACPLPAGVTSVPTCTASIGTLSYDVGTEGIASINSVTNQITAGQPGTTVITASSAGSGSSAGYFSTCPPKSISLTLQNGATEGTITQGVQQNLVTKVIDTKGNTITGISLDYQSTDPIDISVGSSGGVSTSFPGVASIFAICQPSTCNPSPINEVGLNGTGLAISSNPVTITTPGTSSDYVWFGAPGQSQYFTSIELLNGTTSSTVRLPYVPNSMVLDRDSTNIYFGSSHGLMVYSAANNSFNKDDPTVPGVVLAVAPNNSAILINDQVRGLFYIYSAGGVIEDTFGGMGAAASWTPDSKTLYITDSASLGAGHSDTLYVYNADSGWTTNGLSTQHLGASGGATSLAITIPGVGAYLSGNPTVAHTWCPTGTVGSYATMDFYPEGDSVSAQTDVLAATTDGRHILGAAQAGGGIILSDIGVTIPPGECPLAGSDGKLQALTLSHTLNQLPLNVNADMVNQILPSPASNLAFITYTGSAPGATLPYYVPGTAGKPGTVNFVALSGAAAVTAPLAGAFTPDDKLFFVSTAGDNKVHFISIPNALSGTTQPKDTQQISPNLPACTPVSAGGNDSGCVHAGSGTIVPATVIAVKPRSTT